MPRRNEVNSCVIAKVPIMRNIGWPTKTFCTQKCLTNNLFSKSVRNLRDPFKVNSNELNSNQLTSIYFPANRRPSTSSEPIRGIILNVQTKRLSKLNATLYTYIIIRFSSTYIVIIFKVVSFVIRVRKSMLTIFMIFEIHKYFSMSNFPIIERLVLMRYRNYQFYIGVCLIFSI